MSSYFENPASVASRIDNVFAELQSLAERMRGEPAVSIARAAGIVHAALVSGNKILACGNGGSAAEAQHFVAELVGRFLTERDPLAGVALTVDTSILTAVANDYGYDDVFARQVRAIGNSNDVLVAMSTSGRSPNVLKALATAQELGLRTIALIGSESHAKLDACDVVITIPDTSTPRVQEMHLAVLHTICDLVDEALLSEA